VADVVSPETRSRMMSGIRRKDTKPEMTVRKALFAAGFRFRLHRRDLAGAPDVVLLSRKIAIFVHGCFWHRHSTCRLAKLPATNIEFWSTKLNGNVKRDKRAVNELQMADWRVLVVWECATRGEAAEELKAKLTEWIEGDAYVGEIRETVSTAA
jgi:DNA mismatch endonuclease, patch repair protein